MAYEILWSGARDRDGTCFSLVSYLGPSQLASAIERAPGLRNLSQAQRDQKRHARLRRLEMNRIYCQRWRDRQKAAS